MSDAMGFDWVNDPYGEFLDLPPGERPPQLYQLLELELFCAHRERIEHAVRKQFRRIKPFQEHPERAIRERIQDVMNRIAHAKVVLTDPDRKEAYDRELAERLRVDRERILSSRLAAPLPDFALAVTAGPTGVGHTVELVPDTVVSIGRDPHCELPLGGARPAPLHGELRDRAGNWWYTHMDKAGQSLVNGEPVTRVELVDGDRLDIAGHRLRFRRIAASGDHGTQRRRINAETQSPQRVSSALPALTGSTPVEGPGPQPSGAASSPPTAGPASACPPAVSLIVTRGPAVPDAAFSALAPEAVTIGRSEAALWQISGPGVSRRHCRIEFEADRWSVVDLQSTAGTMLNGIPLTGSPLHDRDTLSIGSFEVTVSLRH